MSKRRGYSTAVATSIVYKLYSLEKTRLYIFAWIQNGKDSNRELRRIRSADIGLSSATPSDTSLVSLAYVMRCVRVCIGEISIVDSIGGFVRYIFNSYGNVVITKLYPP